MRVESVLIEDEVRRLAWRAGPVVLQTCDALLHEP